MGATPAIHFHHVTKSFGEKTFGEKPFGERGYTAIADVTFDAAPGSFVGVVGPSGCGKSTLLNLAAGLLAPSQGHVEVFGDPLTGLNRRAGYMFQQDALLPWKTVLENVALGLELQGRESRVDALEWVRRVGLSEFANAYPAQLSGGMKKRAAMAQSFIVNPDILLMDEPFSALDVHTRLRMETVLLDLWTASPKTVLFVTHDLSEALALADEVILLAAGPASTVAGHYRVALDRPRDLMDIRTHPRFSELYREIWARLREEVLRSYERTS